MSDLEKKLDTVLNRISSVEQTVTGYVDKGQQLVDKGTSVARKVEGSGFSLEGYTIPLTILVLSGVALAGHYTAFAAPIGVGVKDYLTGGARWFIGYLKTAFGVFASNLENNPEAALLTLRNWLWPLGPALAVYGYLRVKAPALFSSVKTQAAEKLWPKEARERINQAETDGEMYRDERDKAVENQNNLQLTIDKHEAAILSLQSNINSVKDENEEYAAFVAGDKSVKALWDLKHGNK